MYSAKILADSLAPCGKRLTTWELTYPRFVHAELMTHRLFSRNSASSRAIPAVTLRKRVIEDPAAPVFWGANQKGMQAGEEVADKAAAEAWWFKGRDLMSAHHEAGERLGIHKQIVNRVIEPWMFITVLVTATEFDNWFKLRAHKEAQPEIAWVAFEMQKLYEENVPRELKPGNWHLPLIYDDDLIDLKVHLYPHLTDLEFSDSIVAEKSLCMVATGRCARVSYLTHDGRRDLREDIGLCERLSVSGHWSPFEHVAQAMSEAQWNDWALRELEDAHRQSRLFDPSRLGNFVGWKQFRKFFSNEGGRQ